MMKVPAEISVRVIRSRPEEAAPYIVIDEIVEGPQLVPGMKRHLLKLLSGSGIGILLGLGIFLALNICGVRFGNLETSMIIGIPSVLGLMSSYMIF
ncbi:MAG TPA: hypothetical protein VMD02_04240 [Candidatus Omnitrophota bacterium]|nr:hypothetical protein [Candidatus Omnitrophota bacterium]